MRLRIVSFGKLKTPGLLEAKNYYLKLLQPWVKTEETELKPLAVPEKSPGVRAAIQKKEAAAVLEALDLEKNRNTRIYLLDERGKARDTAQWAADARAWEMSGVQEICFCIGSGLGFGEELRAKAHGLISFGPQTLSHELARVVLAEQLYRTWSVLKGHPYHNAD